MKKIKILLLICFSFCLSISIYELTKVSKETKQAETLKEDLIDLIEINDNSGEETEDIINFDELKKINSDVIGWIKIEDTEINYPIVQGTNNSFYLNHSYDKKWNGAGSIFMDYYSTSDFSDLNTFIYGHHTNNGSMFGELYKYMDATFYKEHPSFYLYTLNGNYVVDVFSAYVDDAESDSYQQKFSSFEAYENYLNNVINKSKYKTDVEVKADYDRIITLYSCSHENRRTRRDRYYVHGILRKL